MSPGNKISVSTFIIFVVSCLLSCGSNPVAPETSLHIADYFPLEEDASWKYDYNYEMSKWDNSVGSATVKGSCELNVIKVIKDNSNTFASVEVSFNMTNGNLLSFRDTTFIRTFDILQTPDTIWYVVDAPSLERLNEGTRIPMMFNPCEGSNYLDLRMFALDLGDLYKYKDELKFEGIPLEADGETLKYTIDTFTYDFSPLRDAIRSTIVLNYSVGIRSIDTWDVAFYSSSSTFLPNNYVKVRMTLLN